MHFVFCLLIDIFAWRQYSDKSSSWICIGFLSSGNLCPVLPWYGTGLAVVALVSCIRFSFKLIGTVSVRSSTHFFFPAGMGFLLFFGCVIILPMLSFMGLGPAPLNVMQKQNNPSNVPCPHPEFNAAFLDCFPWKRIINWRFER